MTASTVPTTLAQVARERRDIVTGEVMAEDRLIRFVAGPGGALGVGRPAPGRAPPGRAPSRGAAGRGARAE